MKAKMLPSYWQAAFTMIDLKNATIKIKDGSSNSITVKIGEGNLTYTERVNREYILDAGRLDDVRNGDEVPMDVRIDAVWEYIKGGANSASVPSIEDALKQKNGASEWVSSDDDPCRPYAVDIEIEYDPPCEGADTETIVFSDFRYEQLDHDLRAGTISVTGRCNVTEATATRGA